MDKKLQINSIEKYRAHKKVNKDIDFTGLQVLVDKKAILKMADLFTDKFLSVVETMNTPVIIASHPMDALVTIEEEPIFFFSPYHLIPTKETDKMMMEKIERGEYWEEPEEETNNE